jgi:hypothetical protein
MVFVRKRKPYYLCVCGATHQSHPDGRPTGIPGDKETRELRGVAHRRLNRVWNWDDRYERMEMYVWIRENSTKEHIGEMNKFELKELIRKIPVTGEVRDSTWELIAKERLRRGLKSLSIG